MEISKIKRLAKELNLNNIANLSPDEFNSDLPNVDYLEYMLSAERRMRKEKNIVKQRKSSRLPRNEFMQKYNGITQWQLNELKKFTWITEEQNLVVIGNCGVGKTSFACMFGDEILSKGDKVFYTTCDYLLDIIKRKESNLKAKSSFDYIKNCELPIIDEFLYITPTAEELQYLFRAITFLNETRSIIFITNRELSEWQSMAEDKRLMQTLTDRITNSSQIIRLTK